MTLITPLLVRIALPMLLASNVVSAIQHDSYISPNSTGLRLQHGFETILVQPFGYDGFRVRAWAFRPPTGSEIGFLYDPPLEGPELGEAHGMSFDTRTNGNDSVTIRNGNTVFKTYGRAGGHYRLSFYRVEPNGTETLLLNEYDPLKALNPRYYSWNGPGGEFSAAFSFSTDPDEQIYGTGTAQDHLINKKGSSIDLINFNTHIPIPMYMSNRGYGFVWNSAAQGRMEFGPHRNRFTSDSTTLVDYAIVSAPRGDYDALQRKLSAITGRAPTPPDFSLGYIQSKNRYENQTEVLLLAKEFRDRNIPVSMIVIDFQSWAFQGDWELDPGLWPNVSHMANEVMRLTSAEMMSSLWPSVEDASANYNILSAEGWMSATRTGPGVVDSWNNSYVRMYDSTNPGARSFLWDTLRRNYYDNGIRNLWIDQADGGSLGEAFENQGQYNYIQTIPYPLPDVLYHAGTSSSVGKLYPWAHQQGVDEGLRNITGIGAGSECKQVTLSRSGFIGSQRFCSMIWTGDPYANWEVLGTQISTLLSAAATGLGWFTVDAGGFKADPDIVWSNDIDRAEYRELFIRWFQWSVFLPFMRNHGERVCAHKSAFTCGNEPWSFGQENIPTIVSYINMRYELGSYIRTLFEQLSATGRMIMRPLYADFGEFDNEISRSTKLNSNVTTQQYMFGPRLLVTPVTLPNVTQWDVYLPKTLETESEPWTYWWTNQTYAGGQTVTVPAPLKHIPLFHLGRREDILSGNVF